MSKVKDKIKIDKSTAAEIRRRMRELADLDEVMAGAEECGEDCTERRARSRLLIQHYQKMLDNFAP